MHILTQTHTTLSLNINRRCKESITDSKKGLKQLNKEKFVTLHSLIYVQTLEEIPAMTQQSLLTVMFAECTFHFS